MENKSEVKEEVKNENVSEASITTPRKSSDTDDSDEFYITELSQKLIDLHNLI